MPSLAATSNDNLHHNMLIEDDSNPGKIRKSVEPLSEAISPMSMKGVDVDVVEDDVVRNTSFYTHVDNSFDENEELIQTYVTGVERPSLIRNPKFWLRQCMATIISSMILLCIVTIGLCHRALFYLPRTLRKKTQIARAWDNHDRWHDEQLVKSPQYYARKCGFDIIDEQVQTEDGYLLRMHRVVCNESLRDKRGPGRGYPVLILHGLFQSSGSFITSEERSLAFWLASQGYCVYLGNNRAAYNMGHCRYSRYAPEFWNYNIRDLALYDLPAMVEYVRQQTKFDKIAFIGHSQGNATAFIALSRWFTPDLGNKISYFAALAPAAFAGPLIRSFPLKYMAHLDWRTWTRLFGVLDFIPLMQSYLFEWNDTNWLPRRKSKMFRFTPQPVSSSAMFWWAGKDGFSSRGALFDADVQWYDDHFPPVSLFAGGQDRLVLIEPLLEHMRKHEPNVNLLRVKIQPQAEHCDHYWAADAVEWCFLDIMEDIERTRTDREHDK
ncbi:hypothetical protein MPSI1_001405 [Malassezia psittaci]|uniref:Partial AB-hydrolase lipase domain-containing protein n=1 Tax=Malassezia psittaci TaxID=1821823 RepID=A0AAF0F8G5_9BASI|nr:hypothetical protein MPSI1_001405 [Malassezia psittaci]